MKKEMIIYVGIFLLAFLFTSLALFFLTSNKKKAIESDTLAVDTVFIHESDISQQPVQDIDQETESNVAKQDKSGNYSPEEIQFLELVEKLKAIYGLSTDDKKDEIVEIEDKWSLVDSTLKKMEKEIAEQKKINNKLEQTIITLRDTLHKTNTVIIERNKKIDDLEKNISNLIASHKQEIALIKDEKIDANLKKLIGIYNNMDPKKAAEILPKMDFDTGVIVLKSIDQKRSAKILAAMQAQTAAAYSQKITK
ncbi:MAG: hypothetical protein RBS16_07175 [Candidatus Cloacimonadales bacterium]|jgi:flagellar motility protein MotE (MotC chaperone)|nr:hypothetical protein [Candidatus Cloacimonadota bacterium]MDD2649529.1 hypothetical protein [Candidatus Cloacimonadota bacterium]MDD3501569.1 hypothetical protein [Candidatus Cloacimonadota bacterium]MDX9977795.1 hypothetical protein [Candidatus Cloacimonadales bacterium]